MIVRARLLYAAISLLRDRDSALRASGPTAPMHSRGACNTRCLCVMNDSTRYQWADSWMRSQTARGEQTRHPGCVTAFGKRGQGRFTVVGFTIFRSLNTWPITFHEFFPKSSVSSRQLLTFQLSLLIVRHVSYVTSKARGLKDQNKRDAACSSSRNLKRPRDRPIISLWTTRGTTRFREMIAIACARFTAALL